MSMKNLIDIIGNRNRDLPARSANCATVCLIQKLKVKVKQSRYRPGVAQEGSRKLRFPDFMTTAQDGGKVGSFTHRPLLSPGKPAARIPLQPSHTETPTHIETRTHNQCGDTLEKSQAPGDGYINVRNMLSVEEVK